MFVASRITQQFDYNHLRSPPTTNVHPNVNIFIQSELPPCALPRGQVTIRAWDSSASVKKGNHLWPDGIFSYFQSNFYGKRLSSILSIR
ncbi:hypothetical protein J6590_071585 [Homalodisca vitripennis]|nr:hypothetical protein J6590_071585 [Homalodisca vitripennis]